MPRLIQIISIIIGFSAVFQGSGFAADKLSVFVSIVPQKYFVQQIGGDLVDVRVMVQPGASPATYEPRPGQMAALAGAKIYFAIGVPFENAWLDKIVAANPGMRVVHTDRGIEKHAMADRHHHYEDSANESHHEDSAGESHHADSAGESHHADSAGEHHLEGGAGLDPHIWLSPPLVKIQARTILAALQEMDPEHRSVYEANYNKFAALIDRLDADLRETFAGKQNLRFMVFHPAWGYFAHAYGLIQVPIEIEGKNPKPAQLQEVIRHAREKGIRVVFVQPQFSTRSAELVAREIGGEVAFANPLAQDWMANLQEVAHKFRAALK